MRSECDLRPTASGSRPCAAGNWIHPDPEAGCVRVYDRPQVARQDPALPQNQVTLLGFCGNEGTGNRARPVVAAENCDPPGGPGVHHWCRAGTSPPQEYPCSPGIPGMGLYGLLAAALALCNTF